VSTILSEDIGPSNLRSERDITNIVEKLWGKRANRTIENYRSAMRQYIAFVEQKGARMASPPLNSNVRLQHQPPKETHQQYDGLTMLKEAAVHHGIHLSLLVAETSLWANPEVHRWLLQENGVGAYFPNVRRFRATAGERRGEIRGSERLDDNSYANHAIKQATGIGRSAIRNFETCHIWPQSCYDSLCHTVIANLVLLPRPLAGLSDHDPDIRAALQFRAFELFEWHPPGESKPTRPHFYPSTWNEPMPFSATIAKALKNRRS
jgi:hypothetical protein